LLVLLTLTIAGDTRGNPVIVGMAKCEWSLYVPSDSRLEWERMGFEGPIQFRMSRDELFINEVRVSPRYRILTRRDLRLHVADPDSAHEEGAISPWRPWRVPYLSAGPPHEDRHDDPEELEGVATDTVITLSWVQRDGLGAAGRAAIDVTGHAMRFNLEPEDFRPPPICRRMKAMAELAASEMLSGRDVVVSRNATFIESWLNGQQTDSWRWVLQDDRFVVSPQPPE
jgi:hypothetical protein